MFFNAKDKIREGSHPKLIDFNNNIFTMMEFDCLLHEIYHFDLKVLYEVYMTI